MTDTQFQKIYSKMLISQENEDKEEYLWNDEDTGNDITNGNAMTYKDVVATRRKKRRSKPNSKIGRTEPSDVYAFVDMKSLEDIMTS